MKKPKKPKPKKPKSQQQPQPQPTLSETRPQHLAQNQPKLVKRISEHPLMLLAGIVATLAVLAGPVADALRQPEISVDPIVDSSRPFAFPFNVKNESWIFDMSNTELFCGIDEIKWRGGGGVQALTVKDAKQVTIEPRELGLFKCSIDLQGGAMSPFDLVRGHILVSVGYRILGIFPRHSSDTDFTWFAGASPPHWVKGKVAK